MPYTDEDRWLIKHYRQVYGWGSKKMMSVPGEGMNWTQSGIQKIVEKVDATGSTARLPGSGRPISVRTAENIAEVEGLVFSQEDQDTIHRESLR